MNIVDFKDNSERLKREYSDLQSQNLALFHLIQDLAQYLHNKLKKSVVITMIYRTNAEQDEIYAGKSMGKREYNKNPWKSPHQFFHAVDIRSSIFSKDEIKEIEDYLNAKYNMSNYYKFTALCHDVGLGDHFHIQFCEV